MFSIGFSSSTQLYQRYTISNYTSKNQIIFRDKKYRMDLIAHFL